MISVEEYREALKPKKANKHRAVRTVVDGITFASGREASRYTDLCLLQRAGRIRNLKCQVRFPMVVKGSKICTYVCDFTYDEVVDGTPHPRVEDCKSPHLRKHPVFRLKAKLLKALYAIEVTFS